MTQASEKLLEAFAAIVGATDNLIARHCAEILAAPMPARSLQPRSLACLRWLDRAVELSEPPYRRAIELLAANRDALHWGQTYSAEDFGEGFLDNYGWLELFGERGALANAELAGGFLILGPHLHYPDHHHVAEELYIPLTGDTAWRKGDSAFATQAAGATIHHPSNVNHAMKTGEEPLVALYVWRGGPLSAKSTIAPVGAAAS